MTLLRLSAALLLLVGLSACKKEKLPEHKRQLQEQRKKAEARRAKARKGEAPTLSKPQQGKAHHDHKHGDDDGHGHGHGHEHGKNPRAMPLEDMDDRKWSKSVKKAIYGLVQAPMQKAPKALRRLAWQGPDALEGMRFYLQLKRQPKAKRAALAFILAELHSFRPDELAKMAHHPHLPFLQRGAIEHLARLKDPHSQKLLAKVRDQEKPMARFIDHANTQKGMSFDRKKLAKLDAVLNAKDIAKAKEAVMAITDFELESGFFVILAAKGARPPIQGLLAKRMVQMAAAGDRSRLRSYAETKRYPPMLRVAAAQALLLSNDPKDKKLLEAIAKDKKDPMAPALAKLRKPK